MTSSVLDGSTGTKEAPMPSVRTGIGFDAHRFGGPGPVVLCGVSIDHATGVEATSDGDVASHAICDALLGSAALEDLGSHFPSDDPQWHNARSIDMVARCAGMVYDRGLEISHIDVSIVAQDVRIAPFRDEMRQNLATAMRIPFAQVSVKATTTDGLGWIGAGEGLAAYAVATVER